VLKVDRKKEAGTYAYILALIVSFPLMAVVKKVVEAHRGEIRMASKPGRGTEVVLELPPGSLFVAEEIRKEAAPRIFGGGKL